MNSIPPPDLNNDRWFEAVSAMEEASESEPTWDAFVQRLEEIRAQFTDLPPEVLVKYLATYSIHVALEWNLDSETVLPLARQVLPMRLTHFEWIWLTAKFHSWLGRRSAGVEEQALDRQLASGAVDRLSQLSGPERREAANILSSVGLS